MSTHSTILNVGSLCRLLAAAAFVLGVGLFGSACSPKYPNCEEDGDCKAGEFCVNQLCQKCRSDADCGPGLQCNGGACDPIPNYCDDSHPCPGGQNCVSNRCEMVSSQVSEPEPVSSGACQLETIYFSYDSATLEASARDAIAKNASCVRERSMSGVRVTGYTDPRGTEEYNLALGDRRARSVEQFMGSLGVEKGKLSTSSMGEEMARGDDESGWAKDRRVEFTTK
jgi:peptidoglycan-associated lipoprotein